VTERESHPVTTADLVFCARCDTTHPRYDCPADPFGPPETITVADLAEGDFVVHIPAQAGTRGARVNSGVAAITPPRTGRWRAGPPRRKVPVPSRAISFHDRDLAGLDVPATHTVMVRRRRPAGPAPLDLEAQVARLQDELRAACEDTAADQGEQIVETGGWYELARAVMDLAGPEISDAAKAEFARRNGLEGGEPR
jgi:hypothetical protein